MSQVIDQPAEPVGDEATAPPAAITRDTHFGSFDRLPLLRRVPRPDRELLWQLLRLAAPIAAEHCLHIVVGVNDTALANYLPKHAPEAASAVGNVGYIFWFIG